MFIVDESYLEDEVRDGFYIPSIAKRAFAAELSLLCELDRICEKYSIKYFADWGTLLGAVRHKGFIPWDDDLDVCMHRNDLEKFLDVAKSELPVGYEIYSFENNDYSWKFVYNIVNTNRMCFNPEYLKTHFNFPYMATIDIFVVDNVYDDEEKEEERRTRIKAVLEAADLIEDGKIVDISKFNYKIEIAERLCNASIDKNLPAIEIKRSLFSLTQTILKEQNDIDTKYVVQMIPWGVYYSFKIPCEYYHSSVRLPFENTTIAVNLKYYTLFLNHKYRRFWEIKMGVGGHGYPYYAEQKKELGEDIDYIPHYKFSEDSLVKDNSLKENSAKSIASEYIDYLTQSFNEMINENNSLQDINDILADCQNNAIAFGNIVEKVKGDNTKTVECLEKYCEILFELSQIKDKTELSGHASGRIKPCMDEIIDNITDEIINRRTVVFLPFKGEYFDKFYPFYEEEKKKENTDVYVMPLPYFYKEYNGAAKGDAVYDLSKYPDDISVLDYKQADLNLMFPDIIYIQNPYDEYNMCFSVPNYFYSSNIRNMTDELAYVPWFETSDFEKDNYPQNYNMQFYCTVPGVVLSDVVFVNSDIIRQRYIDALSAFSKKHSGKTNKALWEERIKVSPFDGDAQAKCRNAKRQLCFYVSPSALIDDGELYISKIKRCIEVFKEASEYIDVIWHIEPYEFNMIKNADESICKKLMDVFETIKDSNIKVDYDTGEQDILKMSDAYYGDGSYLSKDFVIAKKPVMILDVNM